jgi:hypothetical protein
MKRTINVDVLPKIAEEKRRVAVRIIIAICNHALAAKIDLVPDQLLAGTHAFCCFCRVADTF